MTAQLEDPTGEVSATVTLGELVAQRPGRAELFERLRLDYCCGGAKTLGEACRERGLDPDTIRRLILSQEVTSDRLTRLERRDWRQASLTDLSEHLVEVHHEGLRRQLPQIAELIASVMRVHGALHPGLGELPRAFATLREELEPHLELEEQLLFPACRLLESGLAAESVDEALLGTFEHDHTEVGAELARLRELTDDYDTTPALCRTHYRLLGALQALELDLHQHVHEENNILLPRLRAMLDPRQADGSARSQGRPLAPLNDGADMPACCSGWLAEQAHRGYQAARQWKEVS